MKLVSHAVTTCYWSKKKKSRKKWKLLNNQ